jgi:hypothetical protein
MKEGCELDGGKNFQNAVFLIALKLNVISI